MQLAQNHGGVHGHQSVTPRRIRSNYEPSALEHLPTFINGHEIQLFVRTHGLVHQNNAQAHSSSRDVPALGSETNIRAVRNHTIARRWRSPRSRHSRIRLTPGPQGKSDDEEDWGEWRGDGRRARESQIELLPLPVRQHVPDLGSHRFKLRTGCRIEEIAILVDGVLFYTLPSVSALEFPEPEKWKKSWETVYREISSTSRSPRNPFRHNSSSSLAFAKRDGHIFARPHGRITTSRRTRRTPRRTSVGFSSPLCLADCCRISIAHSHSRRFSGPIIPICRRP